MQVCCPLIVRQLFPDLSCAPRADLLAQPISNRLRVEQCTVDARLRHGCTMRPVMAKMTDGLEDLPSFNRHQRYMVLNVLSTRSTSAYKLLSC